ncbi:DNA methyltransferase, partial [Pseudomonas aeruginosa]
DRVNDPAKPLPTVTAANRGELMIASPLMVGVGGRAGQTEPRPGDEPMYTITAKADTAIASAHLVKFRFNSDGADITEPMPTITSGGNFKRPAGAAHALGVCTAFIEQANSGFNTTFGRSMDDPMSTVTNSGSQQRLVTASLATLRRNCVGRPLDEPIPTLTAGA